MQNIKQVNRLASFRQLIKRLASRALLLPGKILCLWVLVLIIAITIVTCLLCMPFILYRYIKRGFGREGKPIV